MFRNFNTYHFFWTWLRQNPNQVDESVYLAAKILKWCLDWSFCTELK